MLGNAFPAEIAAAFRATSYRLAKPMVETALVGQIFHASFLPEWDLARCKGGGHGR